MIPTPEQVEAWAKTADAYSAYCSNPEGFERFAALACAWQREMDAQICEKAEPRNERLAAQQRLVPRPWELAYFQRGQPVTERMRAVRHCAEAIRSDCAEPPTSPAAPPPAHAMPP